MTFSGFDPSTVELLKEFPTGDARAYATFDPAPGTSRQDRIATRIASGSALADCVMSGHVKSDYVKSGYVKSGYLIGRDDATREKSNAALIAFLSRVFGLTDHPVQNARHALGMN